MLQSINFGGIDFSQIRDVLKSYLISGSFKAETGSLSGTCHKPPDRSRVEVVVEAYGKTAYANPLNPDAFPGIRKMEAEVVRMTCNLFNGDPDESCGTVRNASSWNGMAIIKFKSILSSFE